jgi:class 3 adenylate cyclase
LNGPQRVERRLTTILAADVAGYSRLMRADENAMLALLTALWFRPEDHAQMVEGLRKAGWRG